MALALSLRFSATGSMCLCSMVASAVTMMAWVRAVMGGDGWCGDSGVGGTEMMVWVRAVMVRDGW